MDLLVRWPIDHLSNGVSGKLYSFCVSLSTKQEGHLKSIVCRIIRKKKQCTHINIIPLNHHLWPSTSVCWFMHLQRPSLRPMSYFLNILLYLGCFWAPNFGQWVCRPQPITARKVWGCIKMLWPSYISVFFLCSSVSPDSLSLSLCSVSVWPRTHTHVD